MKNRPETVSLAFVPLGGGWRSTVVVRDDLGRRFSRDDWAAALAGPLSLLDRPQKELKRSSRSHVAVRDVSIGGDLLTVVVKFVRPRGYIRLGCGRGATNFAVAMRLLMLGIPAARPLASISKMYVCFSTQSIYLSEYIDGETLYHLFRGELPQPVEQVKADLLRQVATILAQLHRTGYWHRDAKASNFVAARTADGQLKVFLTDMDGIKHYTAARRKQQLRPFWHFICSLMAAPAVSRDDWRRFFHAYCDLVGVETDDRDAIFAWVMAKAQSKFERSLPRKG